VDIGTGRGQSRTRVGSTPRCFSFRLRGGTRLDTSGGGVGVGGSAVRSGGNNAPSRSFGSRRHYGDTGRHGSVLFGLLRTGRSGWNINGI